MKDFYEALRDGFKHITEVANRDDLKKMREDGIQVDTEGYYSFSFGEKGEYELCIEPILDEDKFLVSLYKHRVLLTQKLPVIALKKNNGKD